MSHSPRFSNTARHGPGPGVCGSNKTEPQASMNITPAFPARDPPSLGQGGTLQVESKLSYRGVDLSYLFLINGFTL